MHHTLIYGLARGDFLDVRSKEISRFVLPAVGGLCVHFLYNIIDGIFVGQGVGPLALGAVNESVPFITAAMALAAMFPMGAGTIIAVRMGQGDKEGANNAFMSAFSITAILSIILTLIGTIFSREIVIICGGVNLSKEMVNLSTEYLFFYMAFCFPNLMASCLSIFVRNDGAPGLAFMGMLIGAISNIFLDWLFVFPLQMGVVGAAIASGLGQILACLTLLSHFVRKKGSLRIKRFNPNLELTKTIIRCGTPETVSQLTTPVTSFCYNNVLASMMGDLGISTFSVLSFIFALTNSILMGVCQGMQPLWGRSYGTNNKDDLSYYFKRSMLINIILAILMTIILTVFSKEAIMIFNDDKTLVESGANALPIFFIIISTNGN